MSDFFNGWPEDGEPITDLIERLDDIMAFAPSECRAVIDEAKYALEAKDKRIAELEADVARLREQRDSLQTKVHLCTAYDYLEKRCAELEGDLEVMRLQRDAKRWTQRG